MSSAVFDRSFPRGQTLSNGVWEVTDLLFGVADETVHLGRSPLAPGVGFLVTVGNAQARDHAELFSRLSYSGPALFDLEFIGGFDSPESARYGCEAMVERLPKGTSARKAVTSALPLTSAVKLASDVTEIFRANARLGRLLLYARPETLWVTASEGAFSAVGLSDRYDAFLEPVGPRSRSRIPFFERLYCAPEVCMQGQVSERALTFTAAAMFFEWMTGEYPFPRATPADPEDLCRGDFRDADLPPAVLDTVARGLAPSAADRPDLLEFEDLLRDLRSER